MGKHILLISYLFPPCNAVGAWRARSFAKHFPEEDVKVTVLTRHWSEADKESNIYYDDASATSDEEEAYCRVVRVPYRKPYGYRDNDTSFMHRLYGKLDLIRGRFSRTAAAFEHFVDQANALLAGGDYDLILVSSPPLSLLQLGDYLSRKHDIPWIGDYRDLWDNRVLDSTGQLDMRSRFYNWFYEYHQKKWLKSCAMVSTVSSGLADQIRRLYDGEIEIVHNGYEDELFCEATLEQNQAPKSCFHFSFVGTIYPYQEFEPMIKGLELFIKEKSYDTINLNFIGVDYVPSVAKEIRDRLPEAVLRITDRIKRDEAINWVCRSHVLCFVGWKGYKGYYGTKIFDYIAARKPILLIPSDGDVLDELLIQLKAGHSCPTPEAFCSYLDQYYEEWKSNACIKFNNNEKGRLSYSRRVIAKKFATKIKEVSP